MNFRAIIARVKGGLPRVFVFYFPFRLCIQVHISGHTIYSFKKLLPTTKSTAGLVLLTDVGDE